MKDRTKNAEPCRRRWIGVVLLALVGIALALPGCGGQQNVPSAVPAPPIEIPAPAVLKFVSAQGLDVDLASISASSVPLPALSLNKTIVIDPTTIDPLEFKLLFIGFGPTVGEFFAELFAGILGGIEAIEIPMSEANTGCQATVTFPSTALGYLLDKHEALLDFSDFDLDGQNGPEGCSGNTKIFPVCVRLWLDGVRFLAGVFEEPPVYATSGSVPDALGRGRFKIWVPGWRDFAALIAYQYEQPGTEPQKDVTYFYRFDRTAPFLPTDPFTMTAMEGHTNLFQEGPAASAFKRFNMNAQLFDMTQRMEFTFNDQTIIQEFDFGDPTLKYLAQFREGLDLWSGALDEVSPLFQQLYGDTNIVLPITCAHPSSGALEPNATCDAAGISVADPPAYLRAVTPADYALPSAFANSPPENLPLCSSFLP